MSREAVAANSIQALLSPLRDYSFETPTLSAIQSSIRSTSLSPEGPFVIATVKRINQYGNAAVIPAQPIIEAMNPEPLPLPPPQAENEPEAGQTANTAPLAGLPPGAAVEPPSLELAKDSPIEQADPETMSAPGGIKMDSVPTDGQDLAEIYFNKSEALGKLAGKLVKGYYEDEPVIINGFHELRKKAMKRAGKERS